MLTSNGYRLDESARRLGDLRDSGGLLDDLAALWQRLREDGYVLLRGFLDPAEVLAFRDYYFRTMLPTGLLDADSDSVAGRRGIGPFDRGLMRSLLFDTIVPGQPYQQLCTHPRIVGFFRSFLAVGSDAEVHLHRRRILRHTRPGEVGPGTATQAHYDLVYLREGTDRVLSMWIPLGDCPVERGGLTYLERSHLRTLRDEAEGRLVRPAASITADLPALAEEYDSRWLVGDFRAGDVLVHSAHIVHAATDNVDPDRIIRLSTDIRYQRADDPIDWRWQQHWRDDDGV